MLADFYPRNLRDSPTFKFSPQIPQIFNETILKIKTWIVYTTAAAGTDAKINTFFTTTG